MHRGEREGEKAKDMKDNKKWEKGERGVIRGERRVEQFCLLLLLIYLPFYLYDRIIISILYHQYMLTLIT